jgi:hypothetical protein
MTDAEIQSHVRAVVNDALRMYPVVKKTSARWADDPQALTDEQLRFELMKLAVNIMERCTWIVEAMAEDRDHFDPWDSEAMIVIAQMSHYLAEMSHRYTTRQRDETAVP